MIIRPLILAFAWILAVVLTALPGPAAADERSQRTAGADIVVASGISWLTLDSECGCSNTPRFDADPILGFRAGIIYTAPRNRNLAVEAGLFYGSRGGRWDTRGIVFDETQGAVEVDQRRELRLDALELPLMARISGEGRMSPYLRIGPELSLLLRARLGSRTVTEDAERFDLALRGGVGVEWPRGFVEIGGSRGLRNVLPGPPDPQPRDSYALWPDELRSTTLAAAFGLRLY